MSGRESSARTRSASPDGATSARHHVVLIGIDLYSGGPRALGGCVNDIDAIQDVLLRRLRVPKEQIQRFTAPLDDGTPRSEAVPNQRPTRANLLAALMSIGDEAKPDDRVIVYFSGHGTQREVINPANGGRSYHEALVPTDAEVLNERGEQEEHLLFDWEINHLLGRIAARTPAVTVVLDCCHSAGATREVLGPGVRARFVESSRPFVLPPEMAPPRDLDFHGVAKGSADFMVVAACLDNELARESDGKSATAPATDPQGSAHGALTRALLEQLDALKDAELPELRWAQIWRALVAAVEAATKDQHPWLSSNPARRVFAGVPEQGDCGYAVTFDEATATYRLDAGSLVGVTAGAVVALYPPLGSPDAPSVFPPVGTPQDLRARIGLLKVTSALRATATATADPAKPPRLPLPAGVRGRLIAAGEDKKLAVALAPHDEAMARRLARSPLLQIAKGGATGQVTLVRRSDRSWAITDGTYGTGEEPGPPLPTLPFLPDAAPADPARDVAVRLVEHYYRYTAPLRLAHNCTDLPRALEVRLLDCNSLGSRLVGPGAQDPKLPRLPLRSGRYEVKAGRYDVARGEWIKTGDFFCVQVENTYHVDLSVTLIDCDSDGRVRVHVSRSIINARSRATFWSEGGLIGDPIGPWLPEGQSIGIASFVAIGTTNKEASLDYLGLDMSFAEVASGLSDKPFAPRGPVELWTATHAVLRMTAE